MALLTNLFEGGVSGGTISAANSGGASGNPWDNVGSGPASSTIKYDNTFAPQGSLSCALRTDLTSGIVAGVWDASIGAVGDQYVRFLYRTDALPTAGLQVIVAHFRTAAAGAFCGYLEIANTAGTLRWRVRSLSGAGTFTGTTTPAANTTYRIEARIYSGATPGTTADAFITMRVYSDITAAVSSFTDEINGGTPTTWTFPAIQRYTAFGVFGASQPSTTNTEFVRYDGIMANGGTWIGAWEPAFSNTVVPTVTGALSVGGTLTLNSGTWLPTPSSFNYYWHRADDAAGTNLVEIGATGSTYTLAAADVGKYIRAGVIPVP